MSELEDLIPSIWPTLSVKSSVRFRSVSKSWCASLSDPHFIYKNLTAANEHDLLLLPDLERQHFYSIASHETPLTATRLQVSPPEVHVPPPEYREAGRLSPPCDDMVCFHVLGRCDERYLASMGVWNLTTGETKMVPRLVIDGEPRPFFVTLGFGFDEKRKEYKIVQIVCLGHAKFAGYVYSLSSSSSSNGWRKVGEPKMLYNNAEGRHYSVYSRTYKDGTCYWGLHNLIMSFDMSSEVFNRVFVSIPGVGMRRRRPRYIRRIIEICRLKEGSMAIVTVYDYPTGGRGTKRTWHSEHELWALLDVGVKQSLTKLCVIGCGPEEDEEPFGFWRNELILRAWFRGLRVSISDPFEGEIRQIHIDEPHNITRCLAWKKKDHLPK